MKYIYIHPEDISFLSIRVIEEENVPRGYVIMSEAPIYEQTIEAFNQKTSEGEATSRMEEKV